ncbi:hypothetical protein [Schinkia azotoformans]|uniref:hypothetical protein n=1 Tax=Schinkia azotoformans TaxID=1454 RepID=UPI002DC04529|nr:hypothetical protein [Schinkia azotoformans]MEC1717795.1 hypothetical protein [Schinkia azotoformans]MEC1743573.1 hypothetical protein [Schinkia azotoformans]MEC1746553.1 hypothetical protein [Schinkia azotoformans]MEC1757803.1 hypothetical protein [Schinkia azotoformans]MEC1769302.1 hypothetical protein [Schinkia azotoformans]
MREILLIFGALLFFLTGCNNSTSKDTVEVDNAAIDKIDEKEEQKRINAYLTDIEDLMINKKYDEAKALVEKVLKETEDIEYLSTQNSKAKELVKIINAESAKLAGAANAYYRIVSNVVKEFGVCTRQLDYYNEDSDYREGCNGLAYANLIDFDKDGVSELYILYVTYGAESYIEEVWGYKDGKEVKMYSEETDDLFGGWTSDRTVSINNDGNTYINHSSRLGEVFAYDDYWTIENNVIKITKASAEYIDGNEDSWIYKITENGKDRNVSEEEYNQFLNNLGHPSKKIINGNAGAPAFEIDITNNLNTVMNFLNQLRTFTHQTSLENSVSKLALEKKKGIIAFLNYFTELNTLDVEHYKDPEIMEFIIDANFYNKFSEQELPQVSSKEAILDNHYYYPYSAESVNQLTKKLFGITLQPKNISVVNPDDEYDLAKYKDGYFYILIPDIGGDNSISSPQINALYDLGNGLYYVEFVICRVDFFDVEGLDEKYLLDPFNTWNDTEKSQSYYLTPGYAIIKEVKENRKNTWQLVRYSTNGKLLSDAEIEQYVKN